MRIENIKEKNARRIKKNTLKEYANILTEYGSIDTKYNTYKTKNMKNRKRAFLKVIIWRAILKMNAKNIKLTKKNNIDE